MSRVFVNPQAGRDRHTRNATAGADDAWGTTSSQAQFRGYEPAEMRNCRSEPQHVRPALEQRSDAASATGRQYGKYRWHRQKEHFPDHSAVTASQQSQNRSFSAGNKAAAKPSWATVHERPIAHRPFDANSTYNSHQDEAQQSRHGYFPYRDEFAPRSKRLLYELAYQRASRDSVRSGSTADTVSAFTMTSVARSSAHGSVARRSASTPSLASAATADSNRIVGGLAKRRKDAELRSPALWEADRKWFAEKWENEGPAGLTTANFVSSMLTNNMDKHAERQNQDRHILNGINDDECIVKR